MQVKWLGRTFPFRDKLAIGRLGVNGDLLFSDTLFGRRIDPSTGALASGGGRSGREFHPAALLGGERGSAEGILLVLRGMCQKRTTSFRATATVATLTPRRTRIR